MDITRCLLACLLLALAGYFAWSMVLAPFERILPPLEQRLRNWAWWRVRIVGAVLCAFAFMLLVFPPSQWRL
jgi:hypothetical protein